MLKSGLAKKITAMLVIISVLSVVVSLLLMLVMTRQQFTGYINQYDQMLLAQWKPALEEYYSQYGFTGLQDFLGDIAPGRGMGQRRMGRDGQMGIKVRQGQQLIVTDDSGQVVADTQGVYVGQPLGADSVDYNAVELRHDDEKFGTLYVLSPLAAGLATLENDFLTRLTYSSIMLALSMAMIALLLGTAIGRRISSPLASLSTAIHKLAQGKLNHRVQLQGDSEFVKLGQDLNTMAQIMEDAHNNRRRLTADISHELRTPLTFLRGQLEGMQSGSIALDSDNIALLQDEVIRLTKLVRELEDLTLIENHAVPLNLSKFTITFLLERLQPVYTIMQDRGITLIVNTDPEIKEITADLDRLLQILLNLFSNAVQHSVPNGSVELSVKKENEQLLFAVADNGPGIPAAELPHLFERFYRVDEHRNRRSGGMGLGLAIARGYVEAHKGKMWAESQEGQGTTIYFTLNQTTLTTPVTTR